jgi:hypothetical protein
MHIHRHNPPLQIQALQVDLQAARAHTHDLKSIIEKLKAEEADKSHLESLKFHIVLEMFALHVLQCTPSDESISAHQ